MMKELVSLLRFVGSAGCVLEVRPDGKCWLARANDPGRTVSGALIDEALRRGLVRAHDNRLVITDEAKSYLRRFLAAREEAFLDQHRRIEIARINEGDGFSHVRINRDASPMACLSRLRDTAGNAWFPADALAAADRLSEDFHFANLQPRVTLSYEPRLGNKAGPGAGVEMKDSVLAARLRVLRAIDAMGPELAGVALDVCCFEKGLETVERERQWPARSAKLMLKTALQHLHRHYNPPTAATRRRHAWGSEGFRPELSL